MRLFPHVVQGAAHLEAARNLHHLAGQQPIRAEAPADGRDLLNVRPGGLRLSGRRDYAARVDGTKLRCAVHLGAQEVDHAFAKIRQLAVTAHRKWEDGERAHCRAGGRRRLAPDNHREGTDSSEYERHDATEHDPPGAMVASYCDWQLGFHVRAWNGHRRQGLEM